MDIDKRLEEVRSEYLRRMTGGNGTLLQQVEDYTSAIHGKMLRPRLTLMSAATLGEENLASHRTLLMATCVEMLHNASLLHDDVIDNAETRRGRLSVNARWNSRVAVLVGDYHLAHIMSLLDETDDTQASRLVNQTVIEMVESELLQQEILSGLKITEDIYRRIIDGKTARLFATSCALGNPQYEDFGLHFGRLFQLKDDIDDGEATEWTEKLIAEEQKTIEGMQFTLQVQYNSRKKY